MDTIVLSKVGGILGPFAMIFGLILNAIYEVLDLVGIQNVALTIVLFTLIANILMLPLTIKQQRYARVSALVTPEVQKIQKKYKGKTDELSQRRLQAETAEIYQKYGASPSSGCLPMLISFPIMIALYRIIYNIPSYVNSIYSLFQTVAEPISKAANGAEIMEGIIKDLNIAVSGFDINNVEKIIDVLNNVKTTGWDTVANAFASNPEVVQALNGVKDTIIEINSMPGGLNVMDAPVHLSQGISGIFPGILIPILAGVTQYLSVKITTPKTNNVQDQQNEMAGSMKTMNAVMPLVSVWFCITLPAGVGLYWVCNAVFRTMGIIIVNRFFNNKDIDQLVKENTEKIAEKKAKKGLNSPSSSGTERSQQSMSDIAKANRSKKDYSSKNYNSSNEDKPLNADSISSIAHMLDKNKKDN